MIFLESTPWIDAPGEVCQGCGTWGPHLIDGRCHDCACGSEFTLSDEALAVREARGHTPYETVRCTKPKDHGGPCISRPEPGHVFAWDASGRPVSHDGEPGVRCHACQGMPCARGRALCVICAVSGRGIAQAASPARVLDAFRYALDAAAESFAQEVEAELACPACARYRREWGDSQTCLDHRPEREHAVEVAPTHGGYAIVPSDGIAAIDLADPNETTERRAARAANRWAALRVSYRSGRGAPR